MLHADLENIPRKVVTFSTEVIEKLDELKADINSSTVKAVEAYVPESAVIVDGAKTLIEAAIVALQALKALGDTDGLNGRLLTLSTSLTNVETGLVHEWGVLVSWIQTIFNKKKK